MRDDAGAFQDVIEITGALQDLIFRTLDHFIGRAGAVLQKELLGRFSFSSFSPDENAFVIELFRDLHSSYSLYMQTHFTKFSKMVSIFQK